MRSNEKPKKFSEHQFTRRTKISSDQESQLKIFIDDINTDHEDPFQEDTFDRKKLANSLTNVINVVDGKRVLALSGPWGNGKTTFLDMWRKGLNLNEKSQSPFTVIYFDAFRYDYYDDPFIVVSGAITEKLTGDVEAFADKAAGVAKKLLPAVLKGAGKAALKRVGIEDDVIQGVVADVSGVFGEEIRNFTQNQKTLLEFKELLKKEIKKMHIWSRSRCKYLPAEIYRLDNRTISPIRNQAGRRNRNGR